MGRTGTLWAYEQIGVEPDAMTVAKALGGGLPIGALVTGPRLADVLQPGDHGSTFAGGPVIAAAALAALKVTDDPALLGGVRELGQLLADALETLPHVSAVRGRGLMLACELDLPAPAVARARAAGGAADRERHRTNHRAAAAAADDRSRGGRGGGGAARCSAHGNGSRIARRSDLAHSHAVDARADCLKYALAAADHQVCRPCAARSRSSRRPSASPCPASPWGLRRRAWPLPPNTRSCPSSSAARKHRSPSSPGRSTSKRNSKKTAKASWGPAAARSSIPRTCSRLPIASMQRARPCSARPPTSRWWRATRRRIHPRPRGRWRA